MAQIGFNQSFETDTLFPGGGGMFIEYHDFIKPVYLFVIIKMILDKETFLPFEYLSNMPPASLVEWYINRKNVNPLKSLDVSHKYDDASLDKYLMDILNSDPSLYDLSPGMNISRMLSIYNKQHMVFPIYVYTKEKELYFEKYVNKVFPGISNVKYVYGDVRECVLNCDTNFTYFFSDISTALCAIDVMKGTFSNVIIGSSLKYNMMSSRLNSLTKLAEESYPMRIESMKQFDIKNICKALIEINYVGRMTE